MKTNKRFKTFNIFLSLIPLSKLPSPKGEGLGVRLRGVRGEVRALGGFLLLFLFFSSCTPKEETLRICTYNIRGDNPNDGVNLWEFRKDSLCKIILEYDFDVVGMQEVKLHQLEDIYAETKYGFVGEKGLYNPIFYKTDRIEVLETDMFWLSESMEPHERGWDGKYERYCTWAKFRDKKTNKIFYVFNTHLDHRGAQAKLEGARLITQQAGTIAGDYPLFIIGDMNSWDTTEPYKAFAAKYTDARNVSPIVFGPVGTAHNFGGVHPVRIDYLFINDKVEIKEYRSMDIAYENNFFPSDHYPVYVDAVLK